MPSTQKRPGKSAAPLPPTRCPWVRNDLAAAYHDTEWGVPTRDPTLLFEFILLEGAQAGLSWDTILAKRERYRERFLGFDPERVARLTDHQLQSMLNDPGLVRNRLKIWSARTNARAWLVLAGQKNPAVHLWSFVGGRSIINRFAELAQIPAETPESRLMSKDLRRRGFTFVGPTIMYAFMQAVGMVNDHLTSCPRHGAVQRKGADAR